MCTMKNILILMMVGLLGFMTSGVILAQGTAQISGAVQDSSGAVLPGAEITATQTETGVSRTTITNETGRGNRKAWRDRERGHSELSWNAGVIPTARCKGCHGDGELYLVPLYR